MIEVFKNFEPFSMNLRTFCNDIYEFCQFEDARVYSISSIVIKILESYPSTTLKNRSIGREFQV